MHVSIAILAEAVAVDDVMVLSSETGDCGDEINMEANKYSCCASDRRLSSTANESSCSFRSSWLSLVVTGTMNCNKYLVN